MSIEFEEITSKQWVYDSDPNKPGQVSALVNEDGSWSVMHGSLTIEGLADGDTDLAIKQARCVVGLIVTIEAKLEAMRDD